MNRVITARAAWKTGCTLHSLLPYARCGPFDKRKVAAICLGTWLILSCAAQTSAPPDFWEETVDLSDVADAVSDWLSGDLYAPDAGAWRDFWDEANGLLQADSLDDLAWFQECIGAAVATLEADPAGRPWADWLRQRADYFEMAARAVLDLPEPPGEPVPDRARPAGPVPARTPAGPGPGRNPPMAPARPKPAQAPPALLDRQRHAAVRDPTRWQRRLAGRPPPPGSATLVRRVKRVFQQEGLPPQLAWIAEAESSLNPEARSPAGAVGLFQFMPATARRFGLRTRLPDERRDPERSARAAARYLRVLHGEFGSWSLALAGYNAGETRVRRLLARAPAPTFEALAHTLPLETQMYVPKVKALVRLRESLDVDTLPAPAR